MMIGRLWFGAALLGAIGMAAGSAWAADPGNPDWPCVQRKVPTISAGMVWAGPPIAEQDRSWRDDAARLGLVEELAARRLPLEEAYRRIDEHAASLGVEKTKELSLLFTGLLQTINAERSEIIGGIERYARKQKALASEIRAKTNKLNALLNKAELAEAEREELKQLEEQLNWESRIFDEREQSLTYVCESPVLLEQRLFALARHIMQHLED